MSVEPHAHHRPVEDQPDDRLIGERTVIPSVPIALYLAPNPADRVLPHGAAEQSRERPAHPARVGPGKIGAGDQRVGPFGTPLVGRNGRVLPLGRLAIRGFEPAPGHAHRHRSEGSHQSALPMAVPVAGYGSLPLGGVLLGKPRPLIPVPPQRSVEFRFQEFLDEAANAGPHPGFQGIKPIVPKEKRCFGRFRRRFCDIRFHGVISLGATTPIRLVETTRRLRHLQIPTTPATAPTLVT